MNSLCCKFQTRVAFGIIWILHLFKMLGMIKLLHAHQLQTRMFMIMPCWVFPIGGTRRKLLPNSWKIGLFPPSPTLPLLFCPWNVDFAIFMQLFVILTKSPHFGNIGFAIIAWRRGQVVQYSNEISFYLFTFLIWC